jgi:hypothetical protein
MLSEEFWTGLLAIVVDLAVYLTSYFLAPELADLAAVVIGSVSAIALLIIKAIYDKKVAAIRAGTYDAYMASTKR